MLQDKIADIIVKLKRVRADNGLSYQRIAELVEQSGEYVSLSTIKRVFEEGSEAYNFQYENTLRPIANAVLGIYSSEAAEPTADEAAAMRAIIEYKTAKVDELTAQLARCEESYKRRIEFLKHQIELKDSRIDRRDNLIERLLETLLQVNQRCENCRSRRRLK